MVEDLSGNIGTLYSSRASVFRLNPETRNSWLPVSDSAIPISFVALLADPDSKGHNEPIRRELKIIGTGENGEILFEANMLPKTTFTKRAQKFCQWVDHKGTLYGFGFASEDELMEFLNTFQQLQRNILTQTVDEKWRQHEPQRQQNISTISEANGRLSSTNGSNLNNVDSNTLANSNHSKRQPIQYQVSGTNRSESSINGNNLNDQDTNNNNLEGKSTDNANYTRSQSMFGLETKPRSNKTSTNTSTSNLATGRNLSPEADNFSAAQSERQRHEQLKYENERLKQALEEGSKNSVYWHDELLTLRTNNVKLTQALRDSRSNVEQWNRELAELREENKELKIRLLDLGSSGDHERANDYKRDLQKYKNYVEEVQTELKRKENEIDQLQRSMDEMKLQSRSNGNHPNESNSSQVFIDPQQRQRLDIINAKLESKLSELVDIHKDFAQLVNQLY